MSFWSWLFRKKGTTLEFEKMRPLPERDYPYPMYDAATAQELLYDIQHPKENTMTTQEQETQDPFIRGNARFTAKAIIRDLAAKQQYITADDVQRELVALGYKVSDLGNAAGSIFRGSEFVTKVEGVTVRSKRDGRRGSAIGVYMSNIYQGNPYLYYDTFVARYNEAQ